MEQEVECLRSSVRRKHHFFGGTVLCSSHQERIIPHRSVSGHQMTTYILQKYKVVVHTKQCSRIYVERENSIDEHSVQNYLVKSSSNVLELFIDLYAVLLIIMAMCQQKHLNKGRTPLLPYAINRYKESTPIVLVLPLQLVSTQENIMPCYCTTLVMLVPGPEPPGKGQQNETN